MKHFSQLFEALDTTNSTNRKVDALVDYFRTASEKDAPWALYFLSGRKMKRLIPAAQIRDAVLKMSGIPLWLFEEAYAQVGDLAETIALLHEEKGAHVSEIPLHEWVEQRLSSLRSASPEGQIALLHGWWRELGSREAFLLMKLITGSFRAGVSHTLVVRALARVAGIAEPVMSHRLMGNWEATATFWKRLMSSEQIENDPGSPYPFYLASPVENEISDLGKPEDWLIEWKWDGIRCQVIHRRGTVYLWSRGEELITDRFPELAAMAKQLPDGTVLDGEILAFRNNEVLPFSMLQQRIGRKKLTPKVLSDVPVVLMAFDLLEEGGQDLRGLPLHDRRARLEALLPPLAPLFRESVRLQANDWDQLAQTRTEARSRKVEGMMLKRLDSPYKVGRKRGDWWKWKVEPFTMDAVLLYAQPGHGRRATLYTDYTFGVWLGEELVPIAKAYSGLTDEEILTLDRWIRAHTIERYGPVRSVEASQVFELAFEAIAPSPRHKAGIAVRFPRILRRRLDKKPAEADSVGRVKDLLNVG